MVINLICQEGSLGVRQLTTLLFSILDLPLNPLLVIQGERPARSAFITERSLLNCLYDKKKYQFQVVWAAGLYTASCLLTR